MVPPRARTATTPTTLRSSTANRPPRHPHRRRAHVQHFCPHFVCVLDAAGPSLFRLGALLARRAHMNFIGRGLFYDGPAPAMQDTGFGNACVASRRTRKLLELFAVSFSRRDQRGTFCIRHAPHDWHGAPSPWRRSRLSSGTQPTLHSFPIEGMPGPGPDQLCTHNGLELFT